MGFNTVAVIYNDHCHEIEKSGHFGERLADAMRNWAPHLRGDLRSNFGAGMIASMAHADYSQVVIVGRNWGQRACDATGLDRYALEEMRECLERHGYRVTKRRKARVSDEHPKDEAPQGLSPEGVPARSCEAGDAQS